MDKKLNNKQRRSVFDNISEKVFSLLKNGMFGYFFTSYDEANEKYLSSVKRKRGSLRRGKTRKGISRMIERSLFVNVMPKLAEWLLRISLRDYGIMMFVMGALISVLYPLNDYVLFLNLSLEMFISGIAVCVCALPMMFSSKSLSHNIHTSKLCGLLLFTFLGINKEKYRVASEKPRVSLPNIAFFVGIGLGVLSYFISPLRLLAIIGLAVLAYCVLNTPEVGIISIILSLPFVSTLALRICVLYVFFCYVAKCIVGKRTFKLEYFDIWVVIVLFFVLVRGSISIKPIESIQQAFLTASLMLAYFVVTNLIRTKEWFRRCLVALLTTGVIVFVISIAQLIIGRLSINVPELGKLFTYGQSVTAGFSRPDELAHYLVAIIPFTIVNLLTERARGKKAIGFLLCTILIVTMLLTHSLSGVIGIVSAILLLLIIYNRNFTYLAIITIIACPVLYFTLPQNALEQILSIKMLDGVSITGFVDTTRDGFQMFISNILGIGSGEGVYNAIFGVDNGYFNNIVIQSLIEYGILGFIVFALFAIMLVRLTFSYCIKAKNQYRRVNCCAGFCGVTGLIVSCMLSYTWHNKSLFLLFWLLVALSFAYVRIEREEEESRRIIKDFTFATLDITLTDDIYHDTVPKRRYVRAPRVALDEEGELEIKEFEESSDSLSIVEEVENQEDGK